MLLLIIIIIQIWENNINEILSKFWIKFLVNFDWIFLNKILIAFKFVEHLIKILKTLDYFLVKFELITKIEITLCQCSWKRGVNNGLNSLSLWGFEGPTSQHLFSMSISPRSGASGLERLACSMYYSVGKMLQKIHIASKKA